MSAIALHHVGQIVIERVGIPKDRWEIAAQLEILGYRDSDARERFGCRDLFETADGILGLFRDGAIRPAAQDENGAPHRNGILRFLRHYLDGLMFSLPMVVQGATMLLWGFGLWGAIDLDVRTGTAIALGFIASYLATSGSAWAIVRRGLFYYYQNEGGLARWSALHLWSLAVRLALGLAVPALLFNFLYRLLPQDMALTAAAYYAALVIFWLNWSLIYLVRRTHWFLVILILSILAVYGAARGLGWPIIAANMLGLAIADVLTFVVALAGLNRWARNGMGKPTVNPPRLTVLIYSTAPVFAYGLLYSVFIFTDRILAWTATRGREDFPPYPFWLNARYELGVDLALVVVVLLAGVVEYSTHQFSERLIPVEKKIRSSAPGAFVEAFRRFHRQRYLVLGLCGVAAVGIAALVVRLLGTYPDPELQESLASRTTMTVFWVAAVSYAVFMFALQNILMLMSLSRVELAVRAIGIALLADVLVGWIISRSIHYSGSVYGLLAGAVVLAILSHRQIDRVLGELDYYYYSAF